MKVSQSVKCAKVRKVVNNFRRESERFCLGFLIGCFLNFPLIGCFLNFFNLPPPTGKITSPITYTKNMTLFHGCDILILNVLLTDAHGVADYSFQVRGSSHNG